MQDESERGHAKKEKVEAVSESCVNVISFHMLLNTQALIISLSVSRL